MLSGTFDVFSLPEVLRMLAVAGKSGTLTIEAQSRATLVELYEGECCGAGSDGEDEPLVADHTPAALHGRLLDVVFENNGHDGGFRFAADGHPRPRPAACVAVEPVLDELEQLEREWREISTVVPSMDAVPVLAQELRSDEISISAFEWSLLARLDRSTSVRQLAGSSGMSLVTLCRALASLVRRGAIDVSGAPAAAPAVAPAVAPAPVTAAEPAPVAVLEPVVDTIVETELGPVGAVGGPSEAVIAADHDEPDAPAVESPAGESAAEAPVAGDRGAMLRLFSALRE